MKSEQILAEMQEVFRDVFDDVALVVTRETCAEDVEDWDSLAQINLVVAFEKKFKIKFSLGELAVLNTVGDMADLIRKKLPE